MIQFARPGRSFRIFAATLCLAVFFSGRALAQSSWQEQTVYTSTGGGGWSPTARNFALGYYGTQSMVQFGPFIDRTRLLSTFDSPAASPVWSRSDPIETRQHRVAAAKSAPVFATMHSLSTDDPFSLRDVIFRVYGPTSSQPVYDSLLPVRTNGHESLFVGIPADGSFVLAAVLDIFGPQAGLPDTYLVRYDTATGTVVTGGVDIPFGGFRFADLSEDGRRVLFMTPFRAVVIDTQTLTEVFTLPFGGSFQVAGGKISGDGATLAIHGAQAGTGVLQSSLLLYLEDANGSYSFDQELLDPAFSRCSSASLSEDGLDLVYGLDVQALAGVELTGVSIDASTRALTTQFNWSQDAAPNLQMYSTAAEISPDGSFAVFGLSGDGEGTGFEVVCFDTGSSVPEAAFDLPGSVWSLDLCGDFVLVSGKRSHFNELLGGGAYRLYSRARDLTFSGGKPRPDANLEVEVTGVPTGFFSRVAYSPIPGIPSVIGNLGRLFIDRNTLLVQPIAFEDGTGRAHGTFRCAPNVGEVRYSQGLHTGAFRRLTDDWLPVMTLP